MTLTGIIYLSEHHQQPSNTNVIDFRRREEAVEN
jgi:hypothetical protein